MAYNPYLPGLEPINTMNNPPYMGNKFAEQLTLPGMNNMNSGYPWSMQGEGASPNSWMTGKTAFLPSDKRHGILQTLDNQVQEGLFMNDANKLQYQNLLRQDTEGFNKGKWDRTLPADRYVNAGNVMNDANILQPDFSKVNKASMIPEGFIDKMKSLYGGITNTDAAQTMNTGNKYANLEDEAWANKQVIRTPGGEIVVDTQSGEVYPDIASFPRQEQVTETAPINTDFGRIDPLTTNQKPGFFEGIGQKLGMTQVSDADRAANEAYMGGANTWTQGTGPFDQGSGLQIGRDPTTGRMIGGDFAGKNAPGTSGWGSANFGEMAQKWDEKYGDMVYKTQKMREKQARIKKEAADYQAKLIADKAAIDAGTGPGTPRPHPYGGPPTVGWQESITGPATHIGAGPLHGATTSSGVSTGKGNNPWGRAQGGYMRSGYNRGGRVGILSVF